jgi:hypothetical protein
MEDFRVLVRTKNEEHEYVRGGCKEVIKELKDEKTLLELEEANARERMRQLKLVVVLAKTKIAFWWSCVYRIVFVSCTARSTTTNAKSWPSCRVVLMSRKSSRW